MIFLKCRDKSFLTTTAPTKKIIIGNFDFMATLTLIKSVCAATVLILIKSLPSSVSEFTLLELFVYAFFLLMKLRETKTFFPCSPTTAFVLL